jgi:RecB family endonuclease NucS
MNSLRKTRTGYTFPSEQALEDFLYQRGLFELYGFIPVARQVALNEEFCDLVAVTTEGQPILIELKNKGERHVVSQLTRYYAALIERKPFRGKLNYDLPVRLMVLSPDFHRHALIDRAYNRLPIEFHRHAIVVGDTGVVFEATDIDTNVRVTVALTVDASTEVPTDEIPAKLQKWLSSCSTTLEHRIRNLRTAILAADNRYREIVVGPNLFLYGLSKLAPVAEIRYNPQRGEPVVFLWLPDAPLTQMLTNRRQKTGRMRLWFHDNDVTHLGYVPEGLGKMKLYAELEKTLKIKPNQKGEEGGAVTVRRPNGYDGYMTLSARGDRKSHLPLPIRKYFERNPIARRQTVLETLVEIAIRHSS